MNSFENSPQPDKSILGDALSKAGKIAAGIGIMTGTTTTPAIAQEDSLSPHIETIIQTETVSPLDTISQATPEELQKAFEHYSKEQEWLLATLSSPEYKRRLIENEGLTEQDAEKRIQNLLETKVFIKHDRLPYIKSDSSGKITAEYNPLDQSIELPPIGYDDPANFGAMIHEGTHSSTRAHEDLSETAKKLYDESYYYNDFFVKDFTPDSLLKLPGITFDDSTLTYYVKTGAPEKTKELFETYRFWYYYHKDPTELDARKKVLEYELDILGVKKYEENFTEEHVQWIYTNWNKLSTNSHEFLNHIRSDKLIEIMNTIAQNKIYDEHNPFPYEQGLREMKEGQG